MDKYHINTIHLDTLSYKTAHMDVEYFYRKRGGYGDEPETADQSQDAARPTD